MADHSREGFAESSPAWCGKRPCGRRGGIRRVGERAIISGSQRITPDGSVPSGVILMVRSPLPFFSGRFLGRCFFLCRSFLFGRRFLCHRLLSCRFFCCCLLGRRFLGCSLFLSRCFFLCSRQCTHPLSGWSMMREPDEKPSPL
jgi:hypothetical protein